MTSETLWVVTTYFNPAGYKRRLQNYRAFRRNLQAPLLTVELARPGAHELKDGDADILVSLTGEDRIWQKERLLNIGVRRLPNHVRYVAWVDCDLVLSDPGWPAAAKARLDQDGGMVQLLNMAVHLPRELDPRSATPVICGAVPPLFTQPAYAIAVREGRIPIHSTADLARRDDRVGKSASHGNAWAARRDVIEACGHFDKAIVGGGDTVHVKAAYGTLDEEYFFTYGLPERYRAAGHAWAERARQAGLFRNVSWLEQSAYHLWHGDLVDRGYLARMCILIENDYDPERDLERDNNDAWRWANPHGALAAGVEAYFRSRREDGEG